MNNNDEIARINRQVDSVIDHKAKLKRQINFVIEEEPYGERVTRKLKEYNYLNDYLCRASIRLKQYRGEE